MTHTATPNTITIGDLITYKITSIKEQNTRHPEPVSIPHPTDLKPFTLLGKETQTIGDTTTHTYFLTLYETGNFTIPTLNNAPAIPITVNSILPTQNTTPIDIYPLIPQRFFPWETLIILLALSSALFAFYVKSKIKTQNSENTQSKNKKINPYTWAKKELLKLETQKNTTPQDHYIKLSYILKFYLSGEFEDAFIESTTQETLKKLAPSLDQETQKRLKNILNLCDQVKFAEYKPNTTETKNSLPKTSQIIDTIHNTRRDTK